MKPIKAKINKEKVREIFMKKWKDERLEKSIKSFDEDRRQYNARIKGLSD